MSVEQPGIEQASEQTHITSAMSLTVRPATEADMPTIRVIAEAAWPVAFGHLISTEFLQHELNREYSDAALKAQIHEQGHCFIMAEQAIDSLTVGFVSYGFRDEDGIKVATVHKLYLLPNLKGKGFGATLLNAAVAASAEAGCARIELSVNRQNPAVQFYERQGFSIVCERDIEVGPGFVRNDYLMAKPLV